MDETHNNADNGLYYGAIKVDVTVVIPTRGRYHTTLPLTIMSIAAQSVKPSRILIYDDGEKADLRSDDTYRYIFNTLDAYGIRWAVNFGDGGGQAATIRSSCRS